MVVAVRDHRGVEPWEVSWRRAIVTALAAASWWTVRSKPRRISNEVNAFTYCTAEGRMSDEHVGNEHTARPFVARTIHRFSVLIILAWLAITVIMTIGVPPLEQVAKEHSVSLNPHRCAVVQGDEAHG